MITVKDNVAHTSIMCINNTASKDTNILICCLKMHIPGIIRLFINLGDTKIQSLKWMFKIHYQKKVLWHICNLIVL